MLSVDQGESDSEISLNLDILFAENDPNLIDPPEKMSSEDILDSSFNLDILFGDELVVNRGDISSDFSVNEIATHSYSVGDSENSERVNEKHSKSLKNVAELKSVNEIKAKIEVNTVKELKVS